MKKRAAFHNLGCRVNSYETELMTQRFLERGYEMVDFDSEAEVYVINTCTVTQTADKKSRQMISRARRRNPNAVVVAAGCAVETGGADSAADIVIGNVQKNEIVDIVEEYMATGKKREPICAPSHDKEAVYGYAAPLSVRTAKTRAFIKVQDGCDRFCTYCIIPYARGRARSRDADEIIREVRALAGLGTREVVLNGINLSSYGGNDGTELIDLAERVAEIKGIERVRLGSLEPKIITGKNAERLRSIKGLCPHFHLSLQSGCDSVLKRMNRRYTAQEFADGVLALREAFDRPAIAADVIAGFPGETEEEHRETVEFLKNIGLYELHVFPYSRREGTAAAAMAGQLPRALKERRAAELIALADKGAALYRQGFVGERARVLWEDTEVIEGTRYITGLTDRYIRAALPADVSLTLGIRGGEVTEGELGGFITDEVMRFVTDHHDGAME